MNIPLKYQKSNEIDQHTINKYKFISNKYASALKKFYKANSHIKYKDKIIDWLFSMKIDQRFLMTCIENKWTTIVLHQLYRQVSNKKNLRFIPRINESRIPFMDSLLNRGKNAPRSQMHNSEHFINYYAMISENYQTIRNYNSLLEEGFLSEIKFYYPNIQSISLNEANYEQMKNYYPFFTLSKHILSDRKTFLYFFNELSGERCFESPVKITNQNSIDIPEWGKQPEGSELCFSISEIFLSFFEQTLSVNFLIFTYENDNFPKKELEEYNLTYKNLIEYYKNKKENDFYSYLNIDKIREDIYYSPIAEKIVENRKYGVNIERNDRCFWKENVPIDKLVPELKMFFSDFNEFESLIGKMMFISINQVFTLEDFFCKRVFNVLYDIYTQSVNEDLLYQLENMDNQINKKKKKKKKNKGKGGNQEIVKEENKEKEKEKQKEQIDEKKYAFSFIKPKNYKKNNILNNVDNNSNNTKENSNYVFKFFMGSKLMTKVDNNNNNNNIKDKEEKNIKFPIDTVLVIYPIVTEIINKSLLNIDEREDSRSSELTQLNSDNQSIFNNDCKVEINQNIQNKKGKKKTKGFFLFSTQKKKKETNSHSPHQKSFISKLNSDIIKYNQSISEILFALHPIREYIISKIKLHISDALSDLYHFNIEIYGSFKSELDIESSDIDLMFNPYRKKVNTSKIIYILSNHFISLNLYEKVIPINSASIPLIKLVIIPEFFLKNEQEKEIISKYHTFKSSSLYSNYQFDKSELDEIKIDITFPNIQAGKNNNKKNAPNLQVEYIKSAIEEHSVIKPTVKILKRILNIKGLNNPYKGGLSSYTLFLLVYAFLKHINYEKGGNYNGNNIFAHFLIKLLKWYSSFQFYNMMVDLRRDYPYIQFVDCIERGDRVPTIIDPITQINAGKSSFNIVDVEILFGNVEKIIKDIKTNYENGDKEIQNCNLILAILKESEL